MPVYFFQGGSEVLKLYVDRINKRLKIASSKTAHRFRPLPYSELFESKEEQAELELKNDEEFDVKLKESVAKKYGYAFARKVDL